VLARPQLRRKPDVGRNYNGDDRIAAGRRVIG
jgi:hypothetical protein